MTIRYRRRPDWLTALETFLTTAAGRTFDRGRHDCALFAADWVLCLTGIDPAAAYRGTYDTAHGAARMLRELAGGGLLEATVLALGAPLPTIALARRGDIAAVTVMDGAGRPAPAIGVVDATGLQVALVGPVGLKFAPISDATEAWAVG